jgi:hypothetical protein
MLKLNLIVQKIIYFSHLDKLRGMKSEKLKIHLSYRDYKTVESLASQEHA